MNIYAPPLVRVLFANQRRERKHVRTGRGPSRPAGSRPPVAKSDESHCEFLPMKAINGSFSKWAVKHYRWALFRSHWTASGTEKNPAGRCSNETFSNLLSIFIFWSTSPPVAAHHLRPWPAFPSRLNEKLQDRVASGEWTSGGGGGANRRLFLFSSSSFRDSVSALEKPAVRVTACNRPRRRHFIPQPSLSEVEQSLFVRLA